VVYRIEVDGKLNASWADRFAGMKISLRQKSNQSSVTILTGRYNDRAELSDVYNSLTERCLPILSVVIGKLNPETGGVTEPSTRRKKP